LKPAPTTAGLAKDILAWLQLKRPKLFGQIEYWIIEPSACRQEWQKETLKVFAPRVRWFAGFQSLLQESTGRSSPATRHPPLHGIIFSNELLDALPVHRLGWDAPNKNGLNGVSLLTAKNLSGPGFSLQSSALSPQPWSRCFPTVTPSKSAPPPKAGARSRYDSWTWEILLTH